jgi:acetyl esterase/lipase
MTRLFRLSPLAASLLLAVSSFAATAAPLPISPTGTISIPALDVPPSSLMSPEGNASRVEHIMLKRSATGSPEEQFKTEFGSWVARSLATFPMSVHKETIAGVGVLIYEPRGGIAPGKAGRVLINLHGGGFVACFVECGGMEAIPVAAMTGTRVISVNYREGAGARYPMATEDTVAVYSELLKHTRADRIGIFGCSAGGLLTAQTLAWLSQHHLPMPAAAGVFCAGGDARMGGDSAIVGKLLATARRRIRRGRPERPA